MTSKYQQLLNDAENHNKSVSETTNTIPDTIANVTRNNTGNGTF